MPPRRKRLEPRNRPIQRRSQATVEDLLAAGARVFEEHGYAAGTTNRIARCAGVSIGTLYQYFPSKDAIAVALLERHVAETSERLHRWAGHMIARRHRLRDALHDYVSEMLEVHCARPRLQHILLEETPPTERVHRALLEGERRSARTVADLLRLMAEVRHADLECAGFLVVQTVETLTHRFAAHPREQLLTREAFVDEVVDMLEAYLTRPTRGARVHQRVTLTLIEGGARGRG